MKRERNLFAFLTLIFFIFFDHVQSGGMFSSLQDQKVESPSEYRRSKSLPKEKTTSFQLSPLSDAKQIESEHKKIFQSTEIERSQILKKNRERREKYIEQQKQLPLGVHGREEILHAQDLSIKHGAISNWQRGTAKVIQANSEKTDNCSLGDCFHRYVLKHGFGYKKLPAQDKSHSKSFANDLIKSSIKHKNMSENTRRFVDVMSDSSEWSKHEASAQRARERNVRQSERANVVKTYKPVQEFKKKNSEYYNLKRLQRQKSFP